MVTNESRSSEPTGAAPPGPTPHATTATRGVPVDMAELSPLRAWLDEQLTHHLGDDERKMLIVAVTEATTNAIESHRRVDTDRPVDVTVDTGTHLVCVEDRGGGLGSDRVDHGAVPSPLASRGRGLLIIRAICPQVRFVETRTGTRVGRRSSVPGPTT